MAPVFVLSGYDAFLGFLLIAAAVPVLALVTNKIVSPKSRTGERDLTYESGMERIGGAWIQFNIRYYMFALVFVIFDVETVFLMPKDSYSFLSSRLVKEVARLKGDVSPFVSTEVVEALRSKLNTSHD